MIYSKSFQILSILCHILFSFDNTQIYWQYTPVESYCFCSFIFSYTKYTNRIFNSVYNIMCLNFIENVATSYNGPISNYRMTDIFLEIKKWQHNVKNSKSSIKNYLHVISYVYVAFIFIRAFIRIPFYMLFYIKVQFYRLSVSRVFLLQQGSLSNKKFWKYSRYFVDTWMYNRIWKLYFLQILHIYKLFFCCFYSFILNNLKLYCIFYILINIPCKL